MKVTLMIGLLAASLFSTAAFADTAPTTSATPETPAVDATKKDEVKAKLQAATPEQKAALKDKLKARHGSKDATAN